MKEYKNFLSSLLSPSVSWRKSGPHSPESAALGAGGPRPPVLRERKPLIHADYMAEAVLRKPAPAVAAGAVLDVEDRLVKLPVRGYYSVLRPHRPEPPVWNVFLPMSARPAWRQ